MHFKHTFAVAYKHPRRGRLRWVYTKADSAHAASREAAAHPRVLEWKVQGYVEYGVSA